MAERLQEACVDQDRNVMDRTSQKPGSLLSAKARRRSV